ncbi:cytochrome P450 family protein [Desmospora profundinema]|uniref:Cytochrome P450 n=1 Tax=Desmospora profundinema TaxID=1571184 RepID=A0ABU1IM89_9BACL|nr:cytochrome P450 [Desmospora profundinema]MDR6225902.1 cytochrome P450 [Desmospora profundinema]
MGSNRPSTLAPDFFSPRFREQAYTLYRDLREKGAVHPIQMPSGEPAWLVTRYDAALAALKDPRFIKNPRTLPDWKDDLPEEIEVFDEHMLAADPPDHTRLRNLVHQAFTPRMIEGMNHRIQEIADTLLDQIASTPSRRCDLIDAYAFPLPILVICEMLGIPADDRKRFREWSNALLATTNRPEKMEEARPKMKEFQEYLGELFHMRRSDPADDLVSRLVHVEEEGSRLTSNELYSMIFLLIIAGHETTVNLIGNGVLALFQHREQRELLRRRPELLDHAVEEILRYYSPVEMATDRWAAEDLSFFGEPIPQGSLVIVALGSANRDKSQFPEPDRFDITRQPNRHLAFGMGIHYCLGAPLARLEAKIAIPTLLERLPELTLDFGEEPLPWRQDFLMRGLTKLPVRF